MQHASPTHPLRSRFLLLSVAAALAACHHHDDDDDEYYAPVYVETEPNDDAFTANYFGELHPGDFFYIDGYSVDDGTVDGFAFTAGQPLHVDFQLFVDGFAADLDVWLYDAQADEVIWYFETSANPERGGVDVDLAGLEFHLLVTSRFGSAPYSLEIDVTPRYLDSTAAETGSGPHATSLDGGARRGSVTPTVSETNEAGADAVERRDHARAARYLKDRGRTLLHVEIERELDPETGTLLEWTRVQTAPGLLSE